MLTKNEKDVLNEPYYIFNNIAKEDKKYYLDIIKHCKDICDTNNTVDGSNKCQIVEISMKKTGNQIEISGSITIGDKVKENRTIEGDMFLEKDKIIVDMLVTRLCTSDKLKKYRVMDEFSIIDNRLQRRSRYNYDIKSIYTDIDDNEMKGRLK